MREVRFEVVDAREAVDVAAAFAVVVRAVEGEGVFVLMTSEGPWLAPFSDAGEDSGWFTGKWVCCGMGRAIGSLLRRSRRFPMPEAARVCVRKVEELGGSLVVRVVGGTLVVVPVLSPASAH